METRPLVNRVAESGIITINLEDFFPVRHFMTFDIKDYLYQGLILKEKDFREALKNLDWTAYTDSIVLVTCSADAIIPQWAYMLIESGLAGIAADTYHGTEEEYLKYHYRQTLEKTDFSQYSEKTVVIKGCGQKPVPAYAYALITRMLKPVARSIMYGEPCSTVPVFKRPRIIENTPQ